MTFDVLTYAARVTENSVAASAPSILGRSYPYGGGASAPLPKGVAAFLMQLIAYFHGQLKALPRWEGLSGYGADAASIGPAYAPLTVIDTALDQSSGPLTKVRMNRALSRRMRWLIKRGRIERSGQMRLTNAKDEARCHLTAGQFVEYSIRVHGQSRVRAYGLGFGRRALRAIAIYSAALQGDVLSLCRAAKCNALLAPD